MKTASVPRVLKNKLSPKNSCDNRLEPRVVSSKAISWKRGQLRENQRRYNLRSTKTESFLNPAAKYLLAQHLFDRYSANHIYNKYGVKQSVDALLTGPDGKTRWLPAMSNEWDRLAQGNDTGVAATDTIDFIKITEVPKHKRVTYATFACDHRPLKEKKWRIRCVIGGDKLPYENDSGSPATDLIETKILFNSVISDAKRGARFMSLDLKDMFLMTPMKDPEFMKVNYKYFPHDIRQRY